MGNFIEITDMNIQHIHELVQNMREGDKEECLALGMTPFQAARRCYKYSMVKKVGLLNGKVAGAFGAFGTVLSDIGEPWLLTTNEVEKAPLRLAIAYRREANELLNKFSILESWCLNSYTKSLKMLELAGFMVSKPEPYGKNGELFCKFSRERK